MDGLFVSRHQRSEIVRTIGESRDFIDSFGGDGSQTVLDLLDDQIVEVICN